MALSTLKLGLHGVAQSLVIKEALNAAHSADGNIAIPEFSVGKVHDLLLSNTINQTLNLGGGHTAAGGDELSANVLGNGGGTIQREEDRGLELSLSTLGLGGGDVGAETHPLTDGEVDEVVNLLVLVGDEVDTPKTKNG